MKRNYIQLKVNTKCAWFVFVIIIVGRESDFSVFIFLQNMQLRTLKFVPKCTGHLHGMGLNVITIKQTLVQLQQPLFAEWD